MNRKVLVAVTLFAALFVMYAVCKRSSTLFNGKTIVVPKRIQPLLALTEKDKQELARLEALVEGKHPEAAIILGQTIAYFPAVQRVPILERYWKRSISGGTFGKRYHAILRRHRKEVTPFCIRSIAQGDTGSVRALHLLELLFNDGASLSVDIGRDGIGALRSALVKGLGSSFREQERFRSQRASALRIVSRYRLKSLLSELARLGREESQLDLRNMAQSTWKKFSGETWPPQE